MHSYICSIYNFCDIIFVNHMNKLILIKTNVNMKQIESIKVGVGGEILLAC
jgi:hypothetical protein